ncbi:MAG: hypothetical protein F6K19_04975 [Cyanothece sp. SIO1E1]|nr:hypothetical protein [Cyanothece sp. SIO1E1]
MDLGKDWDLYLKIKAVDNNLSKAEIQAFFARYERNNIKLFESGTIENIIPKIDPNDPNAVTNYKKNISKVINKFKAEVDFNIQRDRTIILFSWLFKDYSNWRERFRGYLNNADEIEASPEIKLYELLRDLDCAWQKARFSYSLNRIKSVGAFWVKADGYSIQKWLVKCLSCSVSSLETADVLSIDIKPRIRRNFDEFWLELAHKLELSDDIKPDRIISALHERCQTKDLVIALYGICGLGPNLNKLMDQFWRPLVKKTSSVPELEACLLLFLTGKDDIPVDIPIELVSEISVETPEALIELEPLDRIESADIKGWLKGPEVDTLLRQCRPISDGARVYDQLRHEGYFSSEKPEHMLEDICEVFGLEQGLALIENYWKLAG